MAHPLTLENPCQPGIGFLVLQTSLSWEPRLPAKLRIYFPQLCPHRRIDGSRCCGNSSEAQCSGEGFPDNPAHRGLAQLDWGQRAWNSAECSDYELPSLTGRNASYLPATLGATGHNHIIAIWRVLGSCFPWISVDVLPSYIVNRLHSFET